MTSSALDGPDRQFSEDHSRSQRSSLSVPISERPTAAETAACFSETSLSPASDRLPPPSNHKDSPTGIIDDYIQRDQTVGIHDADRRADDRRTNVELSSSSGNGLRRTFCSKLSILFKRSGGNRCLAGCCERQSSSSSSSKNLDDPNNSDGKKSSPSSSSKPSDVHQSSRFSKRWMPAFLSKATATAWRTNSSTSGGKSGEAAEQHNTILAETTTDSPQQSSSKRSAKRRSGIAFARLYASAQVTMSRSSYRTVLWWLPLQAGLLGVGVALVVYGACQAFFGFSSAFFPDWHSVGLVLIGAFRVLLSFACLLGAVTMWPEWVQITILGLHVLLISRLVDVLCSWIAAAAGEPDSMSLGSLVLDTAIAVTVVCIVCFWVMGILTSLKFVLIAGGTGWERMNVDELLAAFARHDVEPRPHSSLPLIGTRLRKSESFLDFMECRAARSAVAPPGKSFTGVGISSTDWPDVVHRSTYAAGTNKDRRWHSSSSAPMPYLSQSISSKMNGDQPVCGGSPLLPFEHSTSSERRKWASTHHDEDDTSSGDEGERIMLRRDGGHFDVRLNDEADQSNHPISRGGSRGSATSWTLQSRLPTLEFGPFPPPSDKYPPHRYNNNNNNNNHSATSGSTGVTGTDAILCLTSGRRCESCGSFGVRMAPSCGGGLLTPSGGPEAKDVKCEQSIAGGEKGQTTALTTTWLENLRSTTGADSEVWEGRPAVIIPHCRWYGDVYQTNSRFRGGCGGGEEENFAEAVVAVVMGRVQPQPCVRGCGGWKCEGDDYEVDDSEQDGIAYDRTESAGECLTTSPMQASPCFGFTGGPSHKRSGSASDVWERVG